MTRDRDIDWGALRDRLAASATALDGEVPADEAREVLEERARRLARTPPVVEAAEPLELLAFRVGVETYAIETRHVREVGRLANLTPLPGAAPALVGVTSLRGEILAVFDLRHLFAIGKPGWSELSRLVVVGGEDPEFGLLADQVLDVTRFASRALGPAPAHFPIHARPLVAGLTAEAWIVLDGERLIADETFLIGDDGSPRPP